MFAYWARPEHTLDLARYLNDNIAQTVAENPKRFVGLLLPVPPCHSYLMIETILILMLLFFFFARIGNTAHASARPCHKGAKEVCSGPRPCWSTDRLSCQWMESLCWGALPYLRGKHLLRLQLFLKEKNSILNPTNRKLKGLAHAFLFILGVKKACNILHASWKFCIILTVYASCRHDGPEEHEQILASLVNIAWLYYDLS